MNRRQELINSGLVSAIKKQYMNVSHNISDDYFVLIADYVDSVNQLEFEGGLYINAMDIARMLPNVLNTVIETNLGGIHGRTDGSRITMNSRLDYETKKLYFFHELTHAIQTKMINGKENCSFYNGNDGMFLTEGATQYTAEILYHLSNGTNVTYREQKNVVRGQSEHTVYSPLSEYQLNGNILLLMSYTMGIPINQVLALGFRSNGRELLKQMYEVFPENTNKFETFMFDLEKIYSIDKLIIAGYKEKLSGSPLNITMQDGRKFAGSLKIQNDLINKIERELVSTFIANNDIDYILQNASKIYSCLTTQKLKTEFKNTIIQIQQMQLDNINKSNSSNGVHR